MVVARSVRLVDITPFCPGWFDSGHNWCNRTSLELPLGVNCTRVILPNALFTLYIQCVFTVQQIRFLERFDVAFSVSIRTNSLPSAPCTFNSGKPQEHALVRRDLVKRAWLLPKNFVRRLKSSESAFPSGWLFAISVGSRIIPTERWVGYPRFRLSVGTGTVFGEIGSEFSVLQRLIPNKHVRAKGLTTVPDDEKYWRRSSGRVAYPAPWMGALPR